MVLLLNVGGDVIGARVSVLSAAEARNQELGDIQVMTLFLTAAIPLV